MRALPQTRHRRNVITGHVWHLEVYEFNEPEKKIKELEQLLSNHPNVNFLIASFGQIKGPDIERITERHTNVFWLTGFTTGVSKVAQRKMLESGKGIVSQNWVNIFRQGRLRENWKGLIESYPDRFLISFYFSYPNHLKSWAPKLNKLYRSGLASLKPETAKLVACQNANRLFKLDITCWALSSNGVINNPTHTPHHNSAQHQHWTIHLSGQSWRTITAPPLMSILISLRPLGVIIISAQLLMKLRICVLAYKSFMILG